MSQSLRSAALFSAGLLALTAACGGSKLVTPVVTAPATVSEGATGLFAVVAAEAGSTFAWTITGGTLTAGQGTNVATFTAGAAGTMTAAVVATNADGKAQTAQASITVVAVATSPTITAPATVAAASAGNAASVPAQGAGSTYAWTISGGTITAGDGTTSITFTAGAVGTLVLTCQVTNAAGVTAPATTKTVTVNTASAPATPAVTAPSVVTTGARGLLAYVAPVAGATYAWTVTGGTITAGQGTSAVVFTAGSAGTAVVSCVLTNAAGSSPAGSASVSVVAAPASVPALTAPASVAAGSTGNSATTAAAAGSTYNWTISGGTITGGQGSASITFSAGDVGTLYLTCQVINAAGAASATGTTSVAVIFAAAPAQPVVTAPAITTTGTAGLVAYVPPVSGASFAWTIGGGTITAGASSNILKFSAGAAGTLTLSVVATNSAGASTAGTANVQVIAAPAAPAITAPDTVAVSSTGNAASVPAQAAGTVYTWTIAGGTITAGQGTRTIAFSAGDAAGALYLSCVAANAVGAASAAGTATVNVATLPGQPAVSAPANATAGQAGLVAYVAPQVGVSYAWTVTGGTITAGQGSNVVTFTAGATGALTAACVLANAAGASAPGSASVNVVDAPITPVIATQPTVAVGSTGNTANVPAQGTASFAWTISGGAITAGQGTRTITFTAGGSAGTLYLSARATNAAGAESAAGSVTVNIATAPSQPTVTAPATVTAGTTGLVAYVAPVAGATYAWTITGGTATAGVTSNVVTFTAGATGTLTAACVVSNAAGPSPSGSANVTVVDAPATPVITAPATVSSNNAGLTASVPAQGAGTTFAWTITGGTITAGQGTAALTFTSGGVGTLYLTCEAANAAGAKSAVGNASVNVLAGLASPQITAAANLLLGSTGNTATVPTQSAGVTYAWTVSAGAITAGQGTPGITFTAPASGAALTISCTLDSALYHPSPGTATPNLLPALASPAVTVDALVTAGHGGRVASIPSMGNGASYTWTVANGTITAGQGTNSITYTPGTAGITLTAGVSVSNALSGQVSGSADATVLAAPYADLLAPSAVHPNDNWMRASISPQAGMTYGFTLTGAAAGALTFGSTNHPSFTAGSSAGTMLLTGTVTNAAGDFATASVNIGVANDTFALEDNSLPSFAGGDGVSVIALANGRVLVSGGHTSGTSSLYTNQAAIYEPYTGRWYKTGSMGSGRAYHTATLLPDGRVLVLGGLNTGTTPNYSEIYDPVSGTWSFRNGLWTPRSKHTATLLSDGKVAVVGGVSITSSASPLTSVELYDPAAGTSVITNSLSLPRDSHTTTLLPNNTLLAIGGSSNATTVEYGTYAGGNLSWTTGTNTLAFGRYNHTATLLPAGAGANAGKILLAGGSSAGAPATTELYDPTGGAAAATSVASGAMVLFPKNVWAASPTTVTGRSQHVAVAFSDGSVLLAGGSLNPNNHTSEIWSSGTTTAAGDMRSGRQAHGAALLAVGPNAGKVLTVGGQTLGYASTTYYSYSAEIYDPAAKTWSPASGVNYGRAQHTATKLSDGTVLLVGGQGEFNNAALSSNVTTAAQLYDKAILARSEIYDPNANAWTLTAGTMSFPRLAHTATLLPQDANHAYDRVLVCGGTTVTPAGTSTAVTSTCEIWAANTGNWTTVASMPLGAVANNGVRQQHTATLLPNGTVLIAGGKNASTSSADVQIYTPDPVALGPGSWAQPSGAAKVLTTARYLHTATLVTNTTYPNGLVVIIGGNSSSASTFTATVEAYDVAGQTFVSGFTSIINGRARHTATLLGTGDTAKLLVAGGSYVNPATGGSAPANVAEYYTPAGAAGAQTAVAAGNLVVARSGHTATLLGASGKVLLTGAGPTVAGVPDQTAELYDTSGAGASTPTTGPMAFPRAQHTATLLNDGSVLITGTSAFGDGASEIYHP